MRSIRTRGALAVAAAVLATAACAGPSGERQPAVTTTAPIAAPTAASAMPPAATTATTAPAATSAAQAGADGPARCTAGELSLSLAEGGAAAGSVYRQLVFTNTGPRTCELRGFPGVSYVTGDDGHQVGPAAEMSGERGSEVPIAPGGTARAQLRLVNVQNYDPAACSPTPVRGLRVYPPGDTAALFVAMEGTGCAATPPGAQLSVQTITP